MADTPEEHLTEELLDRLLHSAKIETYLDEEHITCLLYTSDAADE